MNIVHPEFRGTDFVIGLSCSQWKLRMKFWPEDWLVSEVWRHLLCYGKGGRRREVPANLKIFPFYFPLLSQASKWLRQTQMPESGDKTGDCGCSLHRACGAGKHGAAGKATSRLLRRHLPSGSSLPGLTPVAPCRASLQQLLVGSRASPCSLPRVGPSCSQTCMRKCIWKAQAPQKCGFLPLF